MGCREDGLQELAGTLALQGVDGKGDDNGQREADDKTDDTQQEGILHQRPELGIGEEPSEILEPHPNGGIGKNLVAGHKVLEGDQHAVNRKIVKQKHNQCCRKNHQQIGCIFQEALPFPVGKGWRCYGTCVFHISSLLMCGFRSITGWNGVPKQHIESFFVVSSLRSVCLLLLYLVYNVCQQCKLTLRLLY